ncbi:MAG: hypothetical protein LBH11_02805 [Propionibacteriaceae bacterium]|jgi:hypothetical protein|nr:hypothetical protein [Propionibacteriaceae bacterium]
MLPRHRLRQIVNYVNLATPLGLLVAFVGRANFTRVENGLIVAEGYRYAFPKAGAFTVGNVIITRATIARLRARWPDIVAHEAAHSSQWAWLGPLFLPLYLGWTTWSSFRTGDRASRNYLERWAGLTRGGYTEHPIRRLWIRHK